MTDRIHDNLGVLDQLDGRWRLRFERTLPHPQEKVWRAITEPEHLQRWFPSTIDGERKAGAPLRFEFPFDGAPAMEGEMLTFDPPSTMELTWGDELLRIELTPTEGGTILRLSDVFDEVGKAARDAGGWHSCIDNLTYALSGETPPYDPDKRWTEVEPFYRDRFPAEAQTIGPPDWHPEA
jgi:uncharacterized protein YndB with AHSA1/START domain